MSTKIGPDKPLPYSSTDFSSADEYVTSLLHFLGTDSLLRTLCGGVHILDFFTSDPPLYPRVLPQEWRNWFDVTDIMDILDLLMREDISLMTSSSEENESTWRNGPLPPKSLLNYILLVRKHLLNRTPPTSQCSRNRTLKKTTLQQRQKPLARQVTVGMSIKKIHEVGLFASYLSSLCTSYSTSHPSRRPISHLVDFGSGQNYLGRALASEPYNRNIVAIESRTANAERAREFDVLAKLAVKERVLRNKKVWRETGEHVPPTPPLEKMGGEVPKVEVPPGGTGKILYVDARLEDGNLEKVIAQIPPTSTETQDLPKDVNDAQEEEENLLVMSLHSCGNLLHHGLRSLTLNPSVKIVAMVGCCYNLLTERLGPATYKLPELRPAAHPRLSELAEARDVNGFPMSGRFCNAYPSASHRNNDGVGGEGGVVGDELNGGQAGAGVRLNITSRMMAVQAPYNWKEKDSSDFFKRHFFRALLQRMFLDYGVVGPPRSAEEVEGEGGVSPSGHSSGGTPIVLGSLRKSCYASFVSYVRGALAKLMAGEGEEPNVFNTKMGGIGDEEIEGYERRYEKGKKDLSVIWSLMAFSAGVVESAIVVDRWEWLREQEGVVQECWVEAVFEYAFSPRNLVVVGVKK